MITDRLTPAMRSLAFVLTVAAISVVGSERIFWFWSPDVADHSIGVALYALPVFLTLWLVDRYRLSSWRELALALPLYAYLTEGLLTPVMYSGGPFIPIFPAWFTAWHGILSLGLLVFGLRWLLLHGRPLVTVLVSTAVGLFWGLWSATLRLPENVEDEELIADQGGPLEVLDPGQFTEYVVSFTAILIIGHWLLGWLWPRRYTPSRGVLRVALAIMLIGLVAWSVAVPWALPMFAAYAGLQIWAMRRRPADVDEPTLMEKLAGRVSARRLWPLIAIAPAASAAYTATWGIESLTALRTIMWGTIALQTVFGATVIVWALWGTRSASTGEIAPTHDRSTAA